MFNLTKFWAVMGTAKNKAEVLKTLKAGGDMWVDDPQYGKGYGVNVDTCRAAGLETVVINYGAGFRLSPGARPRLDLNSRP